MARRVRCQVRRLYMLRSGYIFMAFLMGLPLAAQMGGRGGMCCAQGNPAQANSAAPVTTNPVVDVKGVVGQIQITPGQGMPYLEVKLGYESTKVYLGPMRYLVAENFTPKTGEEITVKGYKLTDGVVAIQVTLPQQNKVLKLRDPNGWPLWRGGPWRGGQGRTTGGPPPSQP